MLNNPLNIVEYIERQADSFDVFGNTFDTEFSSIHFMDKTGEGGSDFWFIGKDKVNNLIEAAVCLVIQQFVRHGDYTFQQESKREIYSIVMNHLRDHYGQDEFKPTDPDSPSFEEIMKRHEDETKFRRIFINEDWEKETELASLIDSEFSKEKTLNQYQLKTKWNDEDFIFETERFYVRYNWGTSA